VLEAVRLTSGAREATWFIPASDEGGKGTALVIDTGPLGWRGTIPLPSKRETFDSAADDVAPEDLWVLRESDYLRAGLIDPQRG
jgi:hypothetical protein